MSAETLIMSKGTTCTIKRPTFTKDAGGFPAPTFSNLYTNVPVMVQDYTGNEAREYMRLFGKNGGKAFIPANRGYALSIKDRLIVGSRTLEVDAPPRTRGAAGRPGYQIVVDWKEIF